MEEYINCINHIQMYQDQYLNPNLNIIFISNQLVFNNNQYL